MKQLLLTTSALALAMGSSAQAVEWDVHVGGYMEQFAAWSSPDVTGIVSDDFDGIDSKQDSEIHFLPSITLDNGLKIGADVQLEGFSGSDNIDESFLYVDSEYGRVLLGATFSAGYLMHYGAPDVSFLNVNSGSLTAFVPVLGQRLGARRHGRRGDARCRQRHLLWHARLDLSRERAERWGAAVHLFHAALPRLPARPVLCARPVQGQQRPAEPGRRECRLNNIADFGANYVNSFGPVDFVVSGRYGVAFLASDFDSEDLGDVTDLDGNPTVWGTGLNLGLYGVTVGGSVAEQNNFGAADGTGYDAGIAYETGPWGVSFTYMHGENVDDENFVPTVFAPDETLQQYLLALNYALAEGVDLGAFGAYVDFDEQVGDGAFDNEVVLNPNGDDVDGWVIGTGIKISF